MILTHKQIETLQDAVLGVIAYEDVWQLIPDTLLKDGEKARQFIEFAIREDRAELLNASIAWHFLYDRHGSMIDLLGRLLLSENHEQHQEVLMYCSCPEFAELTPYLDQMLSTEYNGNLKDAPYPKWIYWTLYRINTPEADDVLKKHDMWEEE
ncbi:hypothetical protein [Arundinibacter roseus]|uniref:Uncharacterized protein n=1 Tax=Arundinibacter roseus TaxID=2070510 RepID=A0A4R4KA61_9BACT|nr:hypothetical protein [Arundinibacter roseus]TDB64660.1 hypothetical protein EZE20_13415 [Arundinibacter roseus]